MNENTAPTKRLYRSRRDRVVAGVSGGLGQYFGVDPVLFRLAFVALTFSGFGLLLYIAMAIIVPNWPDNEPEPETTGVATFDSVRGRELAGFVLVGVGLLALAGNTGVFNFIRWDYFWPLVLVGIGAYLVLKRVRE